METSINFIFEDHTFVDAKKHFSGNKNNSIEKTKNKEKWLKILQLFFYSEKVDKCPTIINKVLNYLYTGKLGNGKFTSHTNDLLIAGKKKKIIKDHFSDSDNRTDLIAKKNFFLKLYKLYLDILHDYFSSIETTKTYGKILIYEAPPFKEEPNVVEHFLLNGDKYLSAIIDADTGKFIEDIRKKSQEMVDEFTDNFKDYKNNFKIKTTSKFPDEIIDLFNPESLQDNKKDQKRKDIINELVAKYLKNQVTQPVDFHEKIQTYLEEHKTHSVKTKSGKKKFSQVDETKKWTAFFKTLKTEQYELLLNLEKAITSEIVYIDLILAPIYIDSELRKAWSTKNDFLFDDKTLPVLLFEWAIEHFKYKIRDLRGDKSDPKQLVSTNCLIAFGTPLNTSVSIYEHFADKMFLIDTYGPENPPKENHIDLTQLNSPVAFRKFKNRGRGVVFPMFKSNVIGGNHYPDYKLVKHAFDIEDKEKP